MTMEASPLRKNDENASPATLLARNFAYSSHDSGFQFTGGLASRVFQYD
ncbi:Uncharacterised protein [Mycobacteroides abscessus subsp. massiliense]|nr:Uncharacterised protein [Mycobacteroides abscessus subsp. massiliense]